MKTCRLMMILILMAPPAFAQPATDPWAQVPALPTTCYRQDDDFEGAAHAATDALQKEAARQEEANDAIARQLGDMDMTQQQQRMIAFMMEHPEKAQLYMASLQQGGQAAQEQSPQMTDRALQLETSLQDLNSAYVAALQESLAQIEARRRILQSSPQMCSPESRVEAVELNKAENRAYDSLCASWWKKDGPFHAWFTEFRQHQVEWASFNDEHAEAQKLSYEVMGIAADAFRPTYSLQAPVEYLRQARQVFAQRYPSPASEEPIVDCI